MMKRNKRSWDNLDQLGSSEKNGASASQQQKQANLKNHNVKNITLFQVAMAFVRSQPGNKQKPRGSKNHSL